MHPFPAESLDQVYGRLLAAYGPQHWWPAETPFEVMVGAILTQNTAWTNVEKAITGLKTEGLLSPRALVDCDTERLAAVIKPAGYFNLKARRLQSFCRFLLEQGEEALGKMETGALRHALLAVHGVGHETADDMLLYAFGRPVFVIDAYTRRLFSRLDLCAGDEAYDTLRHGIEAALPKRVAMFNEYHALIVAHAKAHCRKRPSCSGCCLGDNCPAAMTGP